MLHTLFRPKGQIRWKTEVFTLEDRRCYQKTLERARSFTYFGFVCNQNFDTETFIDFPQSTFHRHLADDTDLAHADFFEADGARPDP